jgi:hypothetical protein
MTFNELGFGLYMVQGVEMLVEKFIHEFEVRRTGKKD